jgi:hypothetical protein
MLTVMLTTQDWAVMEPISNLEEKLAEIEPNMAMRFPFTLDRFQKEVSRRVQMT